MERNASKGIRFRGLVNLILRILILLLIVGMMYHQHCVQTTYVQQYGIWGGPASYGGSLLVFRASPWLIAVALIQQFRQRLKPKQTVSDYQQLRDANHKKLFWSLKTLLWSAAFVMWFALFIYSGFAGIYKEPHGIYDEYAGRVVVDAVGHLLLTVYTLEFIYRCRGPLAREWTADQPLFAKILQTVKVFVLTGVENSVSAIGKVFHLFQCVILVYIIAWEMLQYDFFLLNATNPVLWYYEILVNAPYNHFWLIAVYLLVRFAFVEKDL